MTPAFAIQPRVTLLPAGPARPELTTEFFDKGHRVTGRYPVSAEFDGEDFSSPGLAFEDYSRCHVQQRKQSGERRLPTPAWALRPDLLRQVIVHFVERRAEFYQPQPGTERERLTRASQRNAERCKRNEVVLRNLCSRFVALKKANADPAAIASLKIQIENLDTRLRIDRNIAGIVLRVSHLYYCVGLDSVGVATEVGLKPPHVRALIWKLNWIWDLLNGKAKPRYEYKKKKSPNIKRIARMAEKGVSYAIVAKKFGVSRTQIYRLLTEAGLWNPRQAGRKPKIDANVDKYARMAATGLSYSLIGKKFGISSEKVCRRLKKAGLWKPRFGIDKPTIPRAPHQQGRLPYLEHQAFNADRTIGLYLAGKSVPEIARSFGYAPGTGQNRTRAVLIAAGVYKSKA